MIPRLKTLLWAARPLHTALGMSQTASTRRLALVLVFGCAALAPMVTEAAPVGARGFEAPTHMTVTALLGSELGVRGAASFGLVGEVSLGASAVRALLGDFRAPTFHLRLGYDFAALARVPLAVFVQYGSFSGVPFGSPQMPRAAPTALGLTLRFSFDR